MKNKAIFLDRDGTLTQDNGYTHRVEDLVFLPTTFEALKLFQEYGFLLIIVTNQSGIARGIFTEEDFHIFQKACTQKLRNESIIITKTYFCPHHPNFKEKKKCDCRKPNIGMLNQGILDYNLDIKKCLMIGNTQSDIQAGYNAGIQTALLTEKNRRTDINADFHGQTLLSIAKQFLKIV